MKKAYFASGCFWNAQRKWHKSGLVTNSEVGYMMGTRKNPSYEEVCTDETGHAEVVAITYHEDMVSYEDLLDYFFEIHDPTTLNKQGPDRGSQYRSGIYYTVEEEKKVALAKIKELTDKGAFMDPIVTEVLPAKEFYPAEEDHQHYYLKRKLV